ncbi:MAG: prolyl oligopeptidase family serine peptidase [Gammaproteobacteria bacterium]
MVDEGFIFAIAHIRGGQDLGREWYDQGRMMNKMNTFFDFIDCTQRLA